MTRRVLLACSSLVCLFLSQLATAADRPPNVVLVLVDDLGWKDLGCQGSRFFETPHVDALAAQGMRFTQAYAACAVCSPTRSAVLTGKYPARLGITDWIRPRHGRDEDEYQKSKVGGYVSNGNHDLLTPANRFELDLEEITLAERLKEAGYATCHVGKWHLGSPGHLPTDQGFDRNAGGYDFGSPPSYFDPYANRKLPGGIPTLPPREEGEYLAEREADEAVAFIREHKGEPFFLSYWPYEVHTPLQAKPEVVEHYKAKPKTEQSNPTYAAMVQGMDEAVGAITAALDELQLADDTLIVFTSDNGGLLGPTNNAPLRSGKGYPYEGGLRVPLIVRWPGVVPEGTTSDVPACSIDLVPTICEAIGRPVTGDRLDGISLWSHISSGGKSDVDRKTLLWHFPHYRQKDVIPYSVFRSGDWKLIKRYEGPTFELFNLADDPEEKRDLAADEANRVKSLDQELVASLQAIGARLPKPKGSERPRVLILGDSISIGYTPFVQEMLKDEAVVVRPMRANGRAENCSGTTLGVTAIDRWLGIDGGDWDVIHFNFGLHDLKRQKPDGSASDDPNDAHQADPATYEKNLREIVKRLKATNAKLIFATTTPVPKNVSPHRDPHDVVLYNEIALKIAKENDIAIDDLYAFAKPKLEEIQRPANVHFTEAGSKKLAEQVTASIRKALE